MKFLNTSEEVLQALNEDILGLDQWIAPVARGKLDELQLLHTASQALCDALKSKGECFDFPGFIAHMSAFKEMFKSKMAFINIQVEQGIIARRKGGKAAMN